MVLKTPLHVSAREKMSQNRQKYNSRIIKFLLFNTKWGAREGFEEEKLIYHYRAKKKRRHRGSECSSSSADTSCRLSVDNISSDHSLYTNSDNEEEDIQGHVKDIGLYEAVIQFIKNFGQDEVIESIHGQRSRSYLLEVEPDYWMAITISLPKSVHKTVTSLKGVDKGNEPQFMEYHDEELNDHLIKLILLQIYHSFCLLNGRLMDIKETDQLKMVCSQFFDLYLPSIKLFPINLIEMFGAIIYLPLDNLTFMAVQSFINHLLCSEKGTQISHAMFLFNEQLVFSSLDLFNTRVIYRYVVSGIIPEAVGNELSESVKSKTSKRTRFIKNGTHVYLIRESETSDKDELFSKQEPLLLTMYVYRSINGATVLIFLNGDPQEWKHDEMLKKCDLFMANRLFELTAKVADISQKINSSDGPLHEGVMNESLMHSDFFKYVYYNGSNSAFKSNSGTSGFLDHRKISDSEFLRLIIDTESDLQSSLKVSKVVVDGDELPSQRLNPSSNVIEILAKTMNESWLVVYNADARSLFSLLNHKNANLVEASETVINYMSKQFKNILFVD